MLDSLRLDYFIGINLSLTLFEKSQWKDINYINSQHFYPNFQNLSEKYANCPYLIVRPDVSKVDE